MTTPIMHEIRDGDRGTVLERGRKRDGNLEYRRAVARITWVNRHARIQDVLNLTGGARQSRHDRADCPICSSGYLSGDGDRALQLHDDGTAWCHGCSKLYDPAGLWAAWTGKPPARAAAGLAKELGIRPKPGELAALMEPAAGAAWALGYDERLRITAELISFAEDQAAGRYLWDRDDPARPAAVTRTARSPRPVLAMLNRCLALVHLIRTQDDVAAWLDASKRAMAHAIGGQR